MGGVQGQLSVMYRVVLVRVAAGAVVVPIMVLQSLERPFQASRGSGGWCRKHSSRQGGLGQPKSLTTCHDKLTQLSNHRRSGLTLDLKKSHLVGGCGESRDSPPPLSSSLALSLLQLLLCSKRKLPRDRLVAMTCGRCTFHLPCMMLVRRNCIMAYVRARWTADNTNLFRDRTEVPCTNPAKAGEARRMTMIIDQVPVRLPISDLGTSP